MRGAGVVVSHFDEIAAAVERLLDPAVLAGYKANVARVHNQAVFEIPDLLAKIMASASASAPAAAR